jgi:hypothetical protein
MTDNLELRKEILFKTALKMFRDYDSAEDNIKELGLWRQYSGMYKAISIMGYEHGFIEYCRKNGWEVTIP